MTTLGDVNRAGRCQERAGPLQQRPTETAVCPLNRSPVLRRDPVAWGLLRGERCDKALVRNHKHLSHISSPSQEAVWGLAS